MLENAYIICNDIKPTRIQVCIEGLDGDDYSDWICEWYINGEFSGYKQSLDDAAWYWASDLIWICGLKPNTAYYITARIGVARNGYWVPQNGVNFTTVYLEENGGVVVTPQQNLQIICKYNPPKYDHWKWLEGTDDEELGIQTRDAFRYKRNVSNASYLVWNQMVMYLNRFLTNYGHYNSQDTDTTCYRDFEVSGLDVNYSWDDAEKIRNGVYKRVCDWYLNNTWIGGHYLSIDQTDDSSPTYTLSYNTSYVVRANIGVAKDGRFVWYDTVEITYSTNKKIPSYFEAMPNIIRQMYMNQDNKTLTADMFNTFHYNVKKLVFGGKIANPSDGTKFIPYPVYPGDPVKGWYFIALMNTLNYWIDPNYEMYPASSS